MKRLMAPPLPAASRPSNRITTRWPVSLTQACSFSSSTCSRYFCFSYARRDIRFLYGIAAVAPVRRQLGVGPSMPLRRSERSNNSRRSAFTSSGEGAFADPGIHSAVAPALRPSSTATGQPRPWAAARRAARSSARADQGAAAHRRRGVAHLRAAPPARSTGLRRACGGLLGQQCRRSARWNRQPCCGCVGRSCDVRSRPMKRAHAGETGDC